jgi:membrane associated rhomboid family serine protease
VIPLKDHQTTLKTPLITYLVIAANVFVFAVEIFLGEEFIYRYALIPSMVSLSSLVTLLPFVNSQFLHAGFFHILSNMWFLKVFGDNVEERFGRIQFLVIYLLSGIVGGVLQYLFSPSSEIPMLGASGAVAGVLGAYLVFFPRHQIETLIPFGFFSRIVNLPASVILIYWFVTQLFSGAGSIVVSQVGGVAWWAHVGGFATGWIVAKLYESRSGSSDIKFEGYDYVR